MGYSSRHQKSVAEGADFFDMKKPIKILHVVGAMDRGGVETWLMHALRNIDREQFQMDFLVHSEVAGNYDDEIRALGSKVIPCLSPSNPLLYARNFRRILQEYGPYDIVHSHVHYFSGYVLWLASRCGIATRLAHSHNDTLPAEIGAKAARRFYLNVTGKLIKIYATRGLAASEKAAVALYGSDWKKDPRWEILHYSIDLAPFERCVDSSSLRESLGIPKDAFVIGHVGRFHLQKNHVFLIKIFQEIRNHNSNAHLLLVGDGPLRTSIENMVEQLGLSDYVHFLGIRKNIPEIMMGAMDVFVMPSLFEGLPVAGIEMQAAGLPFVLSDVISHELDKIPTLSCRLSLDKSAAVWADSILQIEKNKPAITPQESLAIIEESSFNINTSIKKLRSVYQGRSIES